LDWFAADHLFGIWFGQRERERFRLKHQAVDLVLVPGEFDFGARFVRDRVQFDQVIACRWDRTLERGIEIVRVAGEDEFLAIRRQ